MDTSKPLNQALMLVYMACEYALRSFSIAVVAVVIGWRCIFYILASLAFCVVITWVLDDLSIDQDVMDPGGMTKAMVSQPWVLKLKNLSMSVCHTFLMATTPGFELWNVFGLRHCLKFVLKVAGCVSAVCIALWAVGKCPMTGMFEQQSRPSGITTISCMGMLLILLLVVAVDVCVFSYCVIMRYVSPTFVLVKTQEGVLMRRRLGTPVGLDTSRPVSKETKVRATSAAVTAVGRMQTLVDVVKAPLQAVSLSSNEP